MNNWGCCGFDCDYCPICIKTKENDLEGLKALNKVSSGTINELGCLGCNSNLVHKMCDSCYIKNCNKEKNINICSFCDEFPCEYLNKYITSNSIDNLKRIKIEKKL